MKLVFYDLETTGLHVPSGHENVQICAFALRFKDTNKTSLYHFIPTCGISAGATRINGFQKINENLFKHGEFVEDAYPIADGLEEFYNDIRDYAYDCNDDIILVAHNNFKFDAIVLQKNLQKHGFRLPRNVKFADSMDVMRDLQGRGYGPRRISLDACLQFFYNEHQGFHEAMSDAINCMRIAEQAAIDLGYENYEDYLMANPRAIKQMWIRV